MCTVYKLEFYFLFVV